MKLLIAMTAIVFQFRLIKFFLRSQPVWGETVIDTLLACMYVYVSSIDLFSVRTVGLPIVVPT